MAIEVEPWALVALMVSMPAMVENCLMSGVATALAMVSGEAPGRDADTLIDGKLGARQRRHGEEQVRKYAGRHHGGRHQRGRNRVADAELRNVHRAALPSDAALASPWPVSPARRAAVGAALGYARTAGEAHLALDNNPLPVRHARFHRSAIGFDADQLDVAHFDRLVVLDDEDERALLTALNGHGRDHHGVGPDIEIDLDIHVHPGPQLEACVGEIAPWRRWCRTWKSTLLSTKSSTPASSGVLDPGA